MKRIKYFSIALTLIVIAGAWAQDGEIEFLHTFLPGTYELVGRWPDSGETYTGTAVIQSKGDHFRVSLSINGKEVQGVGRINSATADKIRVLSVEFSRDGREYAATYLIGSDFDNYARLSGRIYLKAGGTKQPGLEAMFIRQPP